MAEAISPSVRVLGPSWRIFTRWLAPLLLFCAVILAITVARREPGKRRLIASKQETRTPNRRCR